MINKPVLPKAIVLQLLPSTLLLGLLLVVATASLMVILMTPLLLAIKYATAVLIVATTVYFILRDALLILPWSWRKIEVNVKGELTLTNKKQQILTPQLAADTFTHQHLTILNFKRNGFYWPLNPVLLLTDFPDKNALRQLRVWIRLFKHCEIKHY